MACAIDSHLLTRRLICNIEFRKRRKFDIPMFRQISYGMCDIVYLSNAVNLNRGDAQAPRKADARDLPDRAAVVVLDQRIPGQESWTATRPSQSTVRRLYTSGKVLKLKKPKVTKKIHDVWGLISDLSQDLTVWLHGLHHGRRGGRAMFNNEYRPSGRYSNTYLGGGVSIPGSVR